MRSPSLYHPIFAETLRSFFYLIVRLNIELRRQARELLTSEKGLYHRSMRPIEPEAVFGDIKFNHHFKRFCLKGKVKVKIEFGLVALVHNMRKYIKLKQELLPNPKIDMGTLVNSMA